MAVHMRRHGVLFLLGLAVTNTLPGQNDLEAGRRLYDSQCALCHAIGGTGGRGPALNRRVLKRAPDQKALEAVISNGIPNSEMPGAWQISPRETGLIAKYVRSLGANVTEIVPGNAARGRQLYEKHRCAACHLVNGEGESWGPDLSSIGERRSAAYLREALEKPAATFPEGFRWIEAKTAKGMIAGVRLREDSFAVQILDTSRKLVTMERSKTPWQAVPGKTPMPPYALPDADLTDLTAYLASLKGGAQ